MPVRARDAMQREGRDRRRGSRRAMVAMYAIVVTCGDRGDRPDRSPPTVREPERRGVAGAGGINRDGGRRAGAARWRGGGVREHSALLRRR